MSTKQNHGTGDAAKSALSYFDYALCEDSDDPGNVPAPCNAPALVVDVVAISAPSDAAAAVEVVEVPACVIAVPEFVKSMTTTSISGMNWIRLAGFTLPTVGLAAALSGMLALTLGGGCADTRLPVQPEGAATLTDRAGCHAADSRSNAPTYAAASPTAAPAGELGVVPQPMGTTTPTVADGSDAAATAVRYTVQKGDSLFRIAHEHYGDGKQWKRIVAANPGVTPKTLKVGQQLIIP